jgi:hypothetical protein
MNRRQLLQALAPTLAAALTFAMVPRHLCSAVPRAFLKPNAEAPVALARSVAQHLERVPTADDFSTGAALFNAEWAYGSHVMGVLGLSQVMQQRPETRAALLPAVRAGCARLVDPASRRFGTAAWGGDGFAPDADGDHAYLGYAALALSVARTVDPSPPWSSQHDALVARLSARVLAAPAAMIETYPGEAYPVDVAAIIGAAAVLARQRGAPPPPVIDHYVRAVRERYVDEAGYLIQAVDAEQGRALDRGRASGTALAAYFIGFADASLQADLYRALNANTGTFLGFAGAREYAPGQGGSGDIDSGPVLLGIGVSATGFMLASARAQGDHERFVGLGRTAMLFGMPADNHGHLRFASGGPLGDAILLAMLTAVPPAPKGGA